MNTDTMETEVKNPVVQFLADYDALQLIVSDFSLYPKILGLCEFHREGFNTVGIYESNEKDIEIKYEISPGVQNGGTLRCTATAPIENHKNWALKFPRDLLLALISNSSNFNIDPKLPLTIMQEFIFRDGDLNINIYAGAEIEAGDEVIGIYKYNNEPTRAYSNKTSDIRTYPTT